MFEPPPTYNDLNHEFTTDFKALCGPGFFPVHSGRVVGEGVSRKAEVRIVLFGTDWGLKGIAETCSRKAEAGGECECQRSALTPLYVKTLLQAAWMIS